MPTLDTGHYRLLATSTGATPVEMMMIGAAQLPLADNESMAFEIQIVASRKDAIGTAAAYSVAGLIRRGAGAASVVLVETVDVITLKKDVGAISWAVGATADSAAGKLSIKVTGEAAKTIDWVAHASLVYVG